jgi:hypothetical protein
MTQPNLLTRLTIAEMSFLSFISRLPAGHFFLSAGHILTSSEKHLTFASSRTVLRDSTFGVSYQNHKKERVLRGIRAIMSL